MTLLGDWNWWLPRWLNWLPKVTIESESDEPEELDPVDRAPGAGERRPSPAERVPTVEGA